MKHNNWYVITGGPSSGKTTMLKLLAQRGHHTVDEAARLVIDEGLSNGLTLKDIRADEKAFQEQVLKRKLAIEAQLDKTLLSFLDRGIHDSAAYYRSYGWELEETLLNAMRSASYKAVFLLDTLPNFHNDYARTEDLAFTERLRQLLHEAYAEYNLPVIHVPVASPEERVEFVLSRIV